MKALRWVTEKEEWDGAGVVVVEDLSESGQVLCSKRSESEDAAREQDSEDKTDSMVHY
jgi:hypothetical protein